MRRKILMLLAWLVVYLGFGALIMYGFVSMLSASSEPGFEPVNILASQCFAEYSEISCVLVKWQEDPKVNGPILYQAMFVDTEFGYALIFTLTMIAVMVLGTMALAYSYPKQRSIT